MASANTTPKASFLVTEGKANTSAAPIYILISLSGILPINLILSEWLFFFSSSVKGPLPAINIIQSEEIYFSASIKYSMPLYGTCLPIKKTIFLFLHTIALSSSISSSHPFNCSLFKDTIFGIITALFL